MTFLNAALFGAGAAAIAIPILIHLLMRRRKKPVMWGAMRFVLEAYRKTRKRLLIERWVLLAARCLLIAAVAFALGRPIVGAFSSDRAGGRSVYLLIDNSLTASALGADGRTSLARHAATARAVLDGLGEGDRVGVILLAGPAQTLLMPPTANTEAVRGVLGDLTAADSRTDLAGALAQVGAAVAQSRASGSKLDPVDRTYVVVLSDWFNGSADIDAALPKLPAGVKLVAASPAAENSGNVTIKEIRPLRTVLVAGGAGAGQPEQAQPATVLLARSGAAVQGAGTTNVTLRLRTGAQTGGSGASVSTANIKWMAGQREASVNIAVEPPTGNDRTAGSAVLVGEIDNDSVAGDNRFMVPIEVRESLRVGLVGSARSGRVMGPEGMTASDWIQLALRPREDSTIDLIDLDPAALDAGRIGGLDAVIVTSPERVSEGDWAKLKSFVEGRSGKGSGMLLVVPPGDVAVHTWTDAMTRGLGLNWQIGREARVFNPADESRPRLTGSFGGSGAGSAKAATDGDLLAAVRGELAELVRPINIWRTLPVTVTGNSGRQLLSLSDGSGLVWATELGGEQAKPAAPRAPANDATKPAGTEPVTTAGGGGSGVLVFVAAALDLKWTDLPAKPLMVPFMQEIVRQGIGKSRGGGWTTAGAPAPTPAQTVQLKAWPSTTNADDASRALSVSDYGQTLEPVRRAGIWDALDSAGGRRGVVAVNADASAGRVEANDLTALTAWLNAAGTAGGGLVWLKTGATGAEGSIELSTLLAARTQGAALGSWVFFVALGLALFELLLARLSSHATPPTSGPGPGGRVGG